MELRSLIVLIGSAYVTLTSVSAMGRDFGPRTTRLENIRERLQTQFSRHRANPPRVNAASSEELLGFLLYTDKHLSLRRNQACSSCHALTPAPDPTTHQPLPVAGFVDPENVVRGTAVSDGSISGRSGSLNAPSAGYAAFSPAFHWDAVLGLYVGGQFWNGRASNLQEQAGLPFLNPAEMAMPSKWAVVTRLQQDERFKALFKKVYDLDLKQIPGNETAPANLTPPPGVYAAYDAMARAIATFEKSRAFNRFTAKFDYFLAGATQLTAQERRGMELFNGKAKCAGCHVSEPGIAPDGSVQPPLFTDFTYDNIGVPRNVRIPGNPEPNLGLGGRADIAARDPTGADVGKHKVMSLRNIAITPPYAHNGVFKTLEQITHFYNTRDTLGRVVDNTDPKFGIAGWPAPEIPQNVNREELGDLGLSNTEEADLVSFMRTLTDGYPIWGHDSNVPPGTPSPFAGVPFPPFP